MTKREEIDAKRDGMRTLPCMNVTDDCTRFYHGVSDINVELFDAPPNPYRTIFEGATATWSDGDSYPSKWGTTAPENRFLVVKAALSGQCLPQALETPVFMWVIRGASRSEFDQHARQRLATFFSVGSRDTSHLADGIRIPSELCPEYGGDPKLYDELAAHVAEYKRLYKKIVGEKKLSFQSARCITPMGAVHSYKYSSCLSSLKAFVAQRARYCEQEDTCQVAICMWEEIRKKFPLVAAHLKPGCDSARRCLYHQKGALSECFSSLFAGCQRWPDPEPYSTFPMVAADKVVMEEASGIHFPAPEEWPRYETYDRLEDCDKVLMGGA